MDNKEIVETRESLRESLEEDIKDNKKKNEQIGKIVFYENFELVNEAKGSMGLIENEVFIVLTRFSHLDAVNHGATFSFHHLEISDFHCVTVSSNFVFKEVFIVVYKVFHFSAVNHGATFSFHHLEISDFH